MNETPRWPGALVAFGFAVGLAVPVAGMLSTLAPVVAAALDINLHTVLRGYQQMREEGLVELRRGRAAVITGQADGLRLRLTTAAEEFARAARQTGASTEEALAAVREALAR